MQNGLHCQHVAKPSDTEQLPSDTPEPLPLPGTSPTFPTPDASTDCKNLPGADDVLVVLKTGASEARAKLLIHFQTTFRCTPHFALFSNVDEVIDGHHVRDALSDIPADVQDANPEFGLYRKLNAHARAGAHNYSEVLSAEQGAKEDNPAWKLDKWKFLPILEKAFEFKPDAKWFVFIEADTALVWPNLLQWLAMFDPQTPYYLGGQAYFDSDEFAHGGAGYVLSQRAVQMAVEYLRDDPARYSRVSEECCGDLILAQVLKQVNISLTRSWPIVQGETPSSLDYSSHHWCHPVVSYHHMNSSEIEELWHFQQSWLADHRLDDAVLHRDVYEHFVKPMITLRKAWDNVSKDVVITSDSEDRTEGELEASRDASACQNLCSAMQDCMQYTYLPGTCRLGNVVRLGHEDVAYPEKVSGWMQDRIEAFEQSLDPCAPRWITSN